VPLKFYPETRKAEEEEKAKVEKKKILQIRDAKGQSNNNWGHVALIDGLSSTKGSLFGDEFGLYDNVWLCVLYDIISFTFESRVMASLDNTNLLLVLDAPKGQLQMLYLSAALQDQQ